MQSRRPHVIDSIIFIALLSGPPKFRARELEDSLRGLIDWVVLLQLAVWGIGFAWICYRSYPLLIGRGLLPRLALPQVLGVGLVFTLAIGTLNSPGRMLTAFSVFQFGVMLAFAYIFVEAHGVRSCLNHLLVGYTVMALMLLAAWQFWPDLVLKHGVGRLRGDLIAPAGAVAAAGLTSLLFGLMRLRPLHLLLLGSGFLAILIASQTRTAFVAFGIVLIFGWSVRSSLPVRRVAPVFLMLLIIGAMFDQLGSTQEYLVREEGSISTLSDRIPLWRHLLSTMLAESPLVGMGFYSASRVLGPQYNPALGTAHSAFVEVFVGGGLIGGGLFVLMFIVMSGYAIRIVMRSGGNNLCLAASALFMIVLLWSITGTDGISAGPGGFTFWTLSAVLPKLALDTVPRTSRTAQVPGSHTTIRPPSRSPARSPLRVGG